MELYCRPCLLWFSSPGFKTTGVCRGPARVGLASKFTLPFTTIVVVVVVGAAAGAGLLSLPQPEAKTSFISTDYNSNHPPTPRILRLPLPLPINLHLHLHLLNRDISIYAVTTRSGQSSKSVPVIAYISLGHRHRHTLNQHQQFWQQPRVQQQRPKMSTPTPMETPRWPRLRLHQIQQLQPQYSTTRHNHHNHAMILPPHQT